MTPRLLVLVVTFLAAACDGPRQTNQDAALLGKIPAGASLVERPRPVSNDVLERFANRISTSKGSSSVGEKVSPGQGRRRLSTAYLKALEDVAYIPREQGEAVIERLVADKSTVCGGTSCRRVFGVKPQETGAFMNHTLAEVAASATLAQPSRAAQRKRLIGALTPARDESATKKAWQEIASLFLTTPRILPALVARPQNILSYSQVEMSLGSRFTVSIIDYTRSHETLRMAEISSDEELIKVGHSLTRIAQLRQKVRVINDGLARLPATNQAVYRGMSQVPAEHMAEFIADWKSKKATYLGPNGRPALTSASWDLAVAREFAFTSKSQDATPKFFVIMVLRNHRGVPIENISEFPAEHEVLISSQQKFLIENIAPILNEPLGFIMYLRGVNGAWQSSLSSIKTQLAA